MAPTGHTLAHLRQEVQLQALPHSSSSSIMTCVYLPRSLRSNVCTPSISSQTLTHRVHSMHLLRSITKKSCEESISSQLQLRSYMTWSTPCLFAIACSS